jgi:NSS family neurotransmitter:Na+ symporter
MPVMERWSSTGAFLLAAIGSAVGIGNIWRFSTVLGQNGGGAYLIPYIIAVFVFAMPLMIMEIALGEKFRGTIVSAFQKVSPRFVVIGWFLCVIVALILSYYLVITGWTLGYTILTLATDAPLFSEFSNSLLPIAFFVIATLVTGLIVSFGVNRGIERISLILIPACVLILLILAAYGTLLPGFYQGLTYMFTPDFSVLADPLLWGAAFGQAFFSLSVGMGILLTYGTYMKSGQHIPRFTLIISLADLFVAFLAGLVIFPIVFTFGLSPTAGAELAFTSLPIAFAQMPVGKVVAVAFFAVLFFAAITSTISMMEVGVAAIRESLGWSRVKTTIVVTGGILLLGLPSAMSYSSSALKLDGIKILDFMDETVGTLGLPVAALLFSVTFAWYLPRETLESALGGKDSIAHWIIPLCRYVIPGALVMTTIARIASGLGVTNTYLLPGTRYIGLLMQLEGITVIVVISLVLIIIACRLRGCNIRKRLGFGNRK